RAHRVAARSKARHGVVAVHVGETSTIRRAGETVVDAHTLHWVAIRIGDATAHAERRGRTNRNHDPATGGTAFHVADQAAHYVFAGGAPRLARGGGVEAVGLVIKVPEVGQRIAVGIGRRGCQRDRRADRHRS